MHEFAVAGLQGILIADSASGGFAEIADSASAALDAVLRRRSHPHVTADAPTHEQLIPLVEAAATVADHGSLRPWRLLEVRGSARDDLGRAISAADGSASPSLKPLRASLLIAVVAIHQPSEKVAEWEQDAVASGVAHTLSLLLDEAGWGVIWRTGHFTRAEAVHAMHNLAHNEKLMGWLYVGGVPEQTKPEKRNQVDISAVLGTL